MRQTASVQIPRRVRSLAVLLLVVGTIAAAYSLTAAPARAWPNLLLNSFYIASAGVAAMFFLATQRAAGARWSASLRRVPEAFLPILPVAGVLMLAVFFGRHVLYSWSNPGAFTFEPAIAGKLRYLQPSWVFTRMVIVVVAWMVFAWLFRRTSIRQDAHPELGLVLHEKLTRYAVAFIPVFALTLTLAAFDWLISADPRWFSTMYAVYVFAGTFVQGIAAIALAVVLLKERGPMRDAVSDHQLHDLGKLLFAFSTFWAYIWTCQYLLIWYGNIPEEVSHYLARTTGPWIYLFALNLVVNWVIPFLVLLSVRAKCTGKTLKAIAALLLCGHWLDLYLLIMPSVGKSPQFGFTELAFAGGSVALLFLVFVRTLNKAPLVPLNDPILAFERAHGAVHSEPVRHRLRGVEQ